MADESPEFDGGDERFLRALFEVAPVAMLAVDSSGVIRVANQEFCDLAGRSGQDVLHRPVEELLPGWPNPEHLRRPDGSEASVEVTFKTGAGDQDSDPPGALAAGGSLTVAVVRDVSEQRRTAADLVERANRDQLTGLSLRHSFFDHLERALRRSRRRGSEVAVLFLDLDGFKALNDRWGHSTGDQVLRTVAQRLEAVSRGEDVVARYGGDEFVAFLESSRGGEAARAVADRITTAIAAPMQIVGMQVEMTASIGVAIAHPDDTADSVLRRADRAMYDAKKSGRGQTSFDTSLRRQLDETEQALRQGLRRHEVVPYYQPIIDLAENTVVGVEALARWLHPTRGVVTPDQFIPLAEECGLIEGLGAEILATACRDIAAWNSPPFHSPVGEVCVNVSVDQIIRPDFARSVRAALQASALPAERLWLEITETRLLTASETVIATLEDLRDIGVRISVDDFGTGYSPLTYLKTLPVDALKIDRSFVQGFASDSLDAGDRAIVRSVIDLANAFGVTTIAEGVETEEQLAVLTALGCAQAQGFYWSPPLAAEHLQDWLQSQPLAPSHASIRLGSKAARVVIVEDQPNLRNLFRLTIEGDDRFTVIGDVEDGRSAVALARHQHPDLLILDLAMPGLGGLEALPMIKAVSPETKVLVLTGLDDEGIEGRSIKEGASAFLLKDGRPQALIDAMASLLDGESDLRMVSVPGRPD